MRSVHGSYVLRPLAQTKFVDHNLNNAVDIDC